MKCMQVYLSSGKYDIIASGEAFLFDYLGNLEIQICKDADPMIKLVLKFEEDESFERNIRTEVVDDSLAVTCVNFTGLGAGLKAPVHIADVDGKEVYFMFFSNCYGEKNSKVRSVKYSVFKEK